MRGQAWTNDSAPLRQQRAASEGDSPVLRYREMETGNTTPRYQGLRYLTSFMPLYVKQE